MCTVIDICAMVAPKWECFTLPGALEGRDVREDVRLDSVEDKSRGREGKLRTELCNLEFLHKVASSQAAPMAQQ